ncbi:hypothetical protein DSL64_04915 [Dyadobacter luteus]|uniref:FAD-binding FR-type domain-containing protein n=2 Tax=Dyadobacter luteus TaxID=2259619 RepID=A0A3D8YGG4_9BACT|nr:hypothetical protein DSL64_04915 [Dyadobacter luteus]
MICRYAVDELIGLSADCRAVDSERFEKTTYRMNIIKQKALSLIENAFGKSGRVLAVRAWESAGFVEIDVHFPEMVMSGWEKVQHAKIKVGEGVYRDYTPAGWDNETHTCTLYVDTMHNGPGSTWASSLQVGDPITYVGVSNTFHKPLSGKMIVLGDMSALGHYLALQQLAAGQSISGAIAVDEEDMAEFESTFRWNVKAVKKNDAGGLASLLQWTQDIDLTNTEVFIAGHIPTGIQLRKELKKRKDQPNSVRVQGFWS